MIQGKFLAALQRHSMVKPGERILLAVSGGSDSTALLVLFAAAAAQLDLTLHVAHLDHGWRGRAAARDAEAVRRLATRFRVPVTVGRVDPAAPIGRRSSSREERARIQRRSFLEATAAAVGADRIALGHTLDDQAESFLMRLLRGSGRRGLGGIHPVIDGTLIRPLLGLKHADLRAWLRRRRIPWREDATNRDLSLTRNRVRRRLLPLLQRQFNPKASEVLARAADLLRDEEDWLERLTADAYDSVALSDRPLNVVLDAKALAAMPLVLRRRVLRRSIARTLGHLRGIDQRHIEQALDVIDRGGRGSLHLPKGLRLNVFPEAVSIFALDGFLDMLLNAPVPPKRAPASVQEALCPVPGTIDFPGFRLTARLAEAGAGLPRAGDSIALLDADLVKGPLVVRPRRPGDRFHPQGAPGSRRLKEFLIDRKVPVNQRGRIPLVLTGERIAWVVGHRIDDSFKITPATRQVLVLTKETR
ncbi:MAG TPA: tRNA lysidine(34) synthetase TilS [Verrucomicrobiae bacterium]|nr:tRNA lysidine(34) synthetase TilS [Verrucomicrobiae bacterium]